MKRTQIYLPENLHRELKNMAVREQTTISYIIRSAAEAHIQKKSPKKIDYYLYDEPYK